ncbi:MAG TPA: sensor histidine kinase [Candidatus Pullilachnospira stercoravium]|uniref:Sensor histidine kinase n=1 Tax=Candidatus Pullilachnospira stercoravium TaxID=2840913 RepID=A0A9D1T5B3_9FIRM|nr:sensor histidine kinase [Candidatus Pullilachnospira stercoravium]
MKKRKFSMTGILFLSFSGMIFFFLLLITFCVSANFSQTFRESSNEKYENLFDQANGQLSMVFYNMSTLSAVLDNSPELISAINLSSRGNNTYERLQNEALAQKMLMSASNYYPYIRNITILKNGNRFSMTSSDLPPIPELSEDSSVFEALISGEKEHLVLSAEDSGSYLYIRAFQRTRIEPSPGILIVELQADFLNQCLESVASDDGAVILAFDAKQQLLYTNRTDDSDFLQEQIPLLASTASGEQVSLGKESYLLTRKTNAFSDWTLVSLVPASASARILYPIYLQILPLFAAVLAVCLLLTFLLSRLITHPFRPLLSSMRRALTGDFSFRPYATRVTEIDTLISGYSRMVARINSQIEEIQRIEKEKRKTELEILQTQISPHFIYNTLNSIRYLALMQDSPRIAEIIGSFSSLLQLTSSHPNELILLSDELQEVSCYIDIMKFRYNAPLRIRWEIQENTRQLKTLKLILQPLVENCFCHAFPQPTDEGQIIIRSRTGQGQLILEIEDNGKGFSHTGPGLPASSGNRHHNIGLTNIQKRIRLWFGDGCGLTIRSLPGQGTLVTLTQPILEEQETTSVEIQPKETNT